MPAILNLFSLISNFKFYIPSLKAIYKDLYLNQTLKLNFSEKKLEEPKKLIKFNSIYYKYPKSNKYALKNINLANQLQDKLFQLGYTSSHLVMN